MIATTLYALLTFSLALCAVFALRRVLRRYCGAVSAYALWALPLAALLAAGLPQWAPSTTARLPMTYAVAGIVHDASATVGATHGLNTVLLMLWLTGSGIALLRLAWRHRRLHRGMHPLPDGMHEPLLPFLPAKSLSRIRLHDAGPAVIWSGRTLLLLPADFLSRFTAEECRLILEHEHTHIRHGDAWWNLVAELATVAFWFHPLVWLARSRFRLDQELACDDSVLQRFPRATRAYAQTLFHGTGHAGTPVLATWLEEPQLKERLTMIRNLAIRQPLRRMGLPALVALLAGGMISAQAMGPMVNQSIPTAKMSYRTNTPPHYPAYARDHHMEGTVVLRVKVGPDGKPLEIRPEPTKTDPMLIESAIAAAWEWRFNPATNAKGQPVTAWGKIPITFSMGNQIDMKQPH